MTTSALQHLGSCGDHARAHRPAQLSRRQFPSSLQGDSLGFQCHSQQISTF